ncbi:unnamed protein product, partial [Rotaria sp. Silwood1]
DVVPITVVFAGAVGGVIGPVAVNFDCLSCGILSDQYTTPPATKPTKTSVTKSTTTETTSITTAT